MKFSRFRKTALARAAALAALVVSLAAACGKTDSNGGNGETHFLAYCELSCGDGLSCVCGICTAICDGSAACEHPGSSCSASTSTCQQAVCDAECTKASDCSELGAGYRCDDGRCRKGTPPLVPPSRESICDGSNDIRFAAVVSGGFLSSEAFFLRPYGHQYLIVDGQCRYYASAQLASEVRTGTLSDEQEAELVTKSAWKSLPAWSSHVDESCPDAALDSLYAPGASTGCSCGCDADSPAGLADALEATRELSSGYYTAGAPLSGPVRVVVVPSDSGIQPPPSQPVFDWPLQRALSSLLVTDRIERDSGTVIDDMAEVTALRALRTQNEQANVTTGIIVIRNASSERFHLLLRDELPDAIASTIIPFLGGS